MKVDRALFLHLVPVVAAASACNSSTATPPTIVAQPPPPASADGPAASASAAASSHPVAAPPSASAVASSAIATDGDAGARATATDAGAAPLTRYTCAQLKCPLGAPYQEAFKILKHDCKALEQNLRPDAFQPLMACMMAHNDTRKTCDLTLWSADPGDCLEGWHQKVAVDPATATTCRRVTGACKKSGTGSLSMADCQGMLSATAARGERKMIACMTEYCDEAPKLCTMAFD